MNDLLSGNLEERRRFQMLPYGAKWQNVKEAPLKDDYDEWLARIVMFCFSLPPDAFTRQRNRSTSETARQSALEEGLMPLMGWVKRLIDAEIQLRMGHPDLEFAWADIKQVDPEVQFKVETSYVKLGVKTVDEARDVLGLDPLPGGIGANPFVVAGNQVLLVEDIEAASAQAVAPPQPPMLPFGARPGGAQEVGRGSAAAPGVERHGARGDAPAAGNQGVGRGRANGAGQASSRGANGSEPAAGVSRQQERLQRAARIEAELSKIAA
jgi:hypothetical protein